MRRGLEHLGRVHQPGQPANDVSLVGVQKCIFDNRMPTPCAARLSSDMDLAAMVETTAVQSLQVSAMATARRAEEKMNAFMVEVNVI